MIGKIFRCKLAADNFSFASGKYYNVDRAAKAGLFKKRCRKSLLAIRLLPHFELHTRFGTAIAFLFSRSDGNQR